jgi:hypothetical protein
MGVSTVPGTPAVPGMPFVPGIPGMPGVAVPGIPGLPGVPVPGVPGVATPVTEVALGPHQGSLLVTATAKFEIVIATAGEVKVYVSDPAGAEIPVAEVAIASLTFEGTPVPIFVALSPGEGFLAGMASPAPPANPVVRFDAVVRGTPLPGITATLTAPAAAAPPATAESPAAPAAPTEAAPPPLAPEPPPARVAKAPPTKRPSNSGNTPPPRRGNPQAQTFAPQPLAPSRAPVRGNVSGSNAPQPPQVQPSPPTRPRVTVTPGAGVSSN